MRTVVVSVAAAMMILVGTNQASAASYVIHIAGNCSTSWTDSTFGGTYAYGGFTNVIAYVDQTQHHDDAVTQFNSVLGSYCRGNNNCVIIAYSNGGAVVSEALDTYGANALWVDTTASNQGGSELADGFTGWVGDWAICNMSDEISPNDHRPAWNHNYPDGTYTYTVASWDYINMPWPFSDVSKHPFITGRHDTVVSFHSAFGHNGVYDSESHGSHPRYSGHGLDGPSNGGDYNHLNFVARGIRCMYDSSQCYD